MQTNDSAFRREITSFIKPQEWERSVSLTLTTKRYITHPSECVVGTPEDYRRNLRWAFNVVNKKIFGNRTRATAKRKGARLKSFCVMEPHINGGWHYHLLIEVPITVEPEQLCELFVATWQRSHWGNKQAWWDESVDAGWLDYMLKPCYGLSVVDKIDWDNTYLEAVV